MCDSVRDYCFGREPSAPPTVREISGTRQFSSAPLKQRRPDRGRCCPCSKEMHFRKGMTQGESHVPIATEDLVFSIEGFFGVKERMKCEVKENRRQSCILHPSGGPFPPPCRLSRSLVHTFHDSIFHRCPASEASSYQNAGLSGWMAGSLSRK